MKDKEKNGMFKARWIVALSLLLTHGVCESAQPDTSEARSGAASPALRTKPQPGGEAAVRRLLAEVAAGKPRYDLLAPALAEMLRQRLPQLRQDLLALGKLESVTFLSVSPDDGADIYSVKLSNGLLKFRIRLDARGKVEMADAYAG
jgi:hypothetical protein